jgi:hypothetical protein
MLAATGVLFIGLSKAGFGGGLGMLTTPLCVLAFSAGGKPPAFAIGVLLPLLCAGDAFSLYHYWRRWEARNLQYLLPGVVVGDIEVGGAGQISPDGTRLAVSGERSMDMNIIDLDTGVATRLTFDGKRTNNPVWSPDGRTLAFSRIKGSAGWDVYTKATDGTGPDAQLFRGPGLFAFPQDWSRDGRWLVALCADTTGSFDLWKVPMDGSGEPEIYQHTPAEESGASLSPDGRWILYTATESGKNGLYVQSFPEPGAKYQIAFPDAAGALWSSDMNEILAANIHSEVFSILVSTENGFRQGAIRKGFTIAPPNFFVDVAPGEQRFLLGTQKSQSSASRLEIVLGWPQLIQGQK